MLNQGNISATKHFEKYEDMYYGASSLEAQRDPYLLRECVIELKLAIKKSSDPFPRAHEALCYIYFLLEEFENADAEANIALRYNENYHRARLIKVFSALNYYSEFAGIRSISIAGLLDMIIGSVIDSGRQSKIKRELERYIQAIRHNVQTNVSARLWITMSEDLMSLADALQHFKIRMPGGQPNLYKEVLKIPWHLVRSSEFDDELEELLRRAEGRALLHDKRPK